MRKVDGKVESLTKRNALIGGRIIVGLLTLTALVVQLVYLAQLGFFNPVNYFSYFTNLSNVFLSVVFLVGAAFLIQRREPTPTGEIIRGASVAAIIIVGIVYGVLLSGEDLGHLMPWVNVVLHIVTPLAGIADWLLLPPKHTLRYQQLGYWLIYPLAYIIYALIRGAIVGFYPYFFVNPALAGGYGGVALYCLGVFVTFLVVGAGLVYLANRLPRSLE